jgi:hypothetical protein
VYPVHPLPLLTASADPLGLVSLIKHSVPTAMEVDAGTVVLAWVCDTRSGRSPLSRLDACCAQPATARLAGQAVPPQAWHDETAGRGRDRLSDLGPLRLCTAGAVRAAMRCGVARRSGPCETTSRRVWGASPCAEPQALPLQGPSGSRQEKRPALQPWVWSTLGVARAVPMWGPPAEGQASAKTRQTTLVAESAPRRAPPGVQPGASRSMAAAAVGPADRLAALRHPWCITRRPATSRAGGRGMAAAVARHAWEGVGGLAPTPPTPPRPGTFDQVAAEEGPLDGTTARAVGGHSRRQEQRRPPPLARARQASSAPLAATGHAAARQADGWQADAEAAAKRRALQRASHGGAVGVKERPTDGPGRPSAKPPRVGQALREGLQGPRHARAEVMARTTQETGGCVLLTHGPTAGERAQRAGDGLRADQEPPGIEPNDGCLQEPRIVKRLCLQKPERLEALGLV